MATSGLMTIISQNTSNLNVTWRSNKLITFNNVLENYISVTDNNTAYLFTDGCNTTKSQNCTEACLDANTAFSSTQTIQNCMQYTNIAKAMRDHRIDRQSLDLAHNMGIIADGNVDSVYIKTTACLRDYNNATRSDTTTGFRYTEPPCVGFSGTSGIQPCFPNICSFSSLNAQLNADVGGIGVYASYYIQSWIALLFFLGFKISFSWTFWLYWPVFMLLRRTNAEGSAQGYQARVRKHLLGSLVTTAVDFQRAQCFFMLALQMAALIILFHKGESLGSSSLQQVMNNYHLIGCLSLGGTLPVSFLLACLHIADRRSWYTFTLSFTTMALSTTTLIYSRTHQISKVTIGRPPYQPPSCEGSNPIKYCLPYNNGEDGFLWIFSHATTIAYCWVVLILVFVDTCLHTWSPTKKIVHSSFESCSASVSKRQSSWTSRTLLLQKWKSVANPSPKLKLCAAVVYKLAEIGYIAGFCVYFADLGAMDVDVPGDWAFGQIVAIMVWAPILLEFIYFELRGMKHSLGYLIAKKLNLIEIEEVVLDDDSDNDSSSEAPHDPSRISRFLQHPLISLLGLEKLTTSPRVVMRHTDEYLPLKERETPPSEVGGSEGLRSNCRLSDRSQEPSPDMA